MFVEHLESHYNTKVKLTNLSASAKSTAWGMSMTDDITRHRPDLVILAFGMNHSASLTAPDFRRNWEAMINKTRNILPNAELILIAPMLGKRD